MKEAVRPAHYLNYPILLIMLWAAPGSALDSDSEQPAILDADQIELDFATGLRAYRGNVIFRQGSIRITCDELTTHFNDDDELDKAVCTGAPGRFRQRPEGADSDMTGSARTITVDQARELVTLQGQAEIVEDNAVLSAPLITYDMKTEKASARGGGVTTPAGMATAAEPVSGNSDPVQPNEADSATTTGGAIARPSLTIQPRKRKRPEGEGDAVSADSDS